MITKELLQTISELDERKEAVDEEGLAEKINLLEKANAKLHSLLITSRMKKLMREFGERETDIYVVTFPKSGTTLMQMILYQLTTDGNMDFEHLYDVSPWCRFSAFFNRPMPSVGERRIVKSHDEYDALAHLKKARFVFVIRDCLDALASFHQHVKDYADPHVDFAELSQRKMREWFEYNTTWLRNPNELKILYVHYEELMADKRAVVQQIAAFCQIPLGETILARVVERTSFAFMKRHESKFGEQPEHWKVYTNFIRSGKVGEGKMKFTPEQLAQYQHLSKAYPLASPHLKRYFPE